MDQVSETFNCKVSSDRSSHRFIGARLADHGPNDFNDLGTFEHGDDHRTRCNVLHELVIEEFSDVDGVVPFGKLAIDLHQFEGSNFQSSTLKSTEDFRH